MSGEGRLVKVLAADTPDAPLCPRGGLTCDRCGSTCDRLGITGGGQ